MVMFEVMLKKTNRCLMVVNQAVSYAPCVLPQAQVVLDTSMGTVGVRWRALALI